MKEFLSRNGVEFTVKNPEEDPAALSEMVEMGLMIIPVTIVDDVVIRGYDEKQLRVALGLS